MQKKYLITAIGIAVLMLIFFFIFLPRGFFPAKPEAEHDPDSLKLVTLFSDQFQHAVINREIEFFNERYPLWAIEHTAVPYRELRSDLQSDRTYSAADIVTIVNPAGFEDTAFHAAPIPWSGELWGLYYHRPTLESALGEHIFSPQTREELEKLFQRAADAGLRPLALGASHGWPLTALVQHTVGFFSTEEHRYPVRDIAAGRLSIDSPPVRQTLSMLQNWRERGWISSTAHDQPWTSGPREVFTGDAAFTLLNQQALTPIPVGSRVDMGFIPFPGEWAIGSVIYLARPASAEDRQSVRELERFLTSSGTVGRLQRNLARPFFGGVQDAELPGEIIPSITSDPNSAYHRNLWQTARSAIWDD